VQELTEDELLLAEYTLLLLPINEPFGTYTKIEYALTDKQESISNDLYRRLSSLTIDSKARHRIRRYLLDYDFIRVVNLSMPYDELTPKGTKAKKLGGFNQYEEWEKEESRKEAKGTLPKRNTILYDAIKMLIPLIAGIIIGRYSCNQPSKADNGQPKNQLQPIKSQSGKEQQQPKTLNSGDSAK
jgi:hypothetical protein